jgi:hypothetical protein
MGVYKGQKFASNNTPNPLIDSADAAQHTQRNYCLVNSYGPVARSSAVRIILRLRRSLYSSYPVFGWLFLHFSSSPRPTPAFFSPCRSRPERAQGGCCPLLRSGHAPEFDARSFLCVSL